MDQGERGERGDQGVRGDHGPRGMRGKSGTPGLTGLSGLDGQDSLMSPNAVKKLLRSMRVLIWTVALIGFGLLGYTIYQSLEGRIALNDKLRAGCVRTSERSAVLASGFDTLADRVRSRGNPGDAESARRYQAASDGVLLTIPSLSYDRRIAEVQIVHMVQGTVYRVTPTARRLQLAGCKLVYPTPTLLP